MLVTCSDICSSFLNFENWVHDQFLKNYFVRHLCDLIGHVTKLWLKGFKWLLHCHFLKESWHVSFAFSSLSFPSSCCLKYESNSWYSNHLFVPWVQDAILEMGELWAEESLDPWVLQAANHFTLLAWVYLSFTWERDKPLVKSLLFWVFC